ncbi:unnamed protein product [Scytosiphon promiscuus]
MVSHDTRSRCSTTAGPTPRSALSTNTGIKSGAVPMSMAAKLTATATAKSCIRGTTVLRMAGEEGDAAATMGMPEPPVPPVPEESNLPFYLDPSTRGGAVVVPILSLLLPLGAYGALTAVGVDGGKAGAWVGVGYTLIGLIAWVGSYFFRVATKNMTYAVQLKNYEQAVIEKRFSELEEDEVDALLDEVNEQ